jgi:hypothetical protein
MHPACPNKKPNHLQNGFLRRTQFWVRKTFSKPASLKRASLVSVVRKLNLKTFNAASGLKTLVALTSELQIEAGANS